MKTNPDVPPKSRLTFQVVNNSAAVMIGQLIYRLLGFFTGVLMIRSLSSETYGEYSFIYVYLSFFEVFIQFGFNSVLTRLAAQDEKAAPRILGNAVLFRSVLSLAVIPFAYGLIGLLHYPVTVRQGVYLAGLQLFLTLRTVYEVIFRAHLRMGYSSLWLCLKGLLQLGLVALVSLWRPSLMMYILAGLISGYAGLLGFALHSKKFLKLDFRPDWTVIKTLMRESYPLLLSGYLTMIYYRVDVFMLSKMRNFMEVGYYSVAVRFAESLDFFSAAVLASIFPVLARTFKESRPDFERAVQKGFRVMLLAGLPMLAGGSLVSKDLVIFLFGTKYLPSAATLGLLLWYTLFCYLGGLLANILIACGKQAVDAWISLILVLINIGLNFFLIPAIGFNGAAVSTVVVEVSGVILITAYAANHPHIRLPVPWKDAGRVLGMNLLFLALLAGMRAFIFIPVWIFIPLSGLIYGGLLLLFGYLKAKDFLDYIAHWKEARP